MAQSPKGRAIIEILLDSNKLNKQLRAVQDNFKRVGANIVKAGAGFTAFGAALVAPLIAATKSFVDFGDTVDKIAARTGASAEFISALGFAAEQSGADIQTLEKAIIGQQRTLNDMNQGLKTAIDSYEALGLSAKDFEGLSTEQSFTKIAQALSEVKDPSLRAATALEIFGKAGQKLIPLLNGGEAAIKAYSAEASKAGLVISPEDAKQAAILADALNKAKRSFQGLQFKIGASLANQFTLIIEKITEYIIKGQKFIENNKGLVKSALQLGAGLVGIGAVLTGLGLSSIVLGSAIGSLTAIVTALVTAFTFATTAAVAFWGSIAAPVAGVTILVGVLLSQILDLETVFKQLGESVASDFGGAINTAKSNFDLLKRAVAAGDLKLAFQILATSAELFFRQAFNSISQAWDNYVADTKSGINNIVTAWKFASFSIVGYLLDIAITAASVADSILNVFSSPLSSIQNLFIRVLTHIRMVWTDIKGLLEAGIRIGKGDIRGAKDVLKEVLKERDELKKQADAKIEANLKLDTSFEESALSKNLKELREGNEAALQDALDKNVKTDAKIISDLGKKAEDRDAEVAKLIKELESLGLAVSVAESKLKKTAESQTQTGDDKSTVNAIKSIAPQFGSLVETGSSAALRLFSSNQNPMVKEQQKTNNTLDIIAENTSGLTTV